MKEVFEAPEIELVVFRSNRIMLDDSFNPDDIDHDGNDDELQ